jgi:single-stranded-DNA-specific exonuclease
VLKQFAPFGPGNMAPVFLSRNVIDTGSSRPVGGQDKKHLKLSMIQKEGNIMLPGIAFQKGADYQRVNSKEYFSICYCIEKNFWQGKTNLQLNVKDIKFENTEDNTDIIEK